MRQDKELYTEQEAAESLGISLPRLQSLLDDHVFGGELQRPPELTLRYTDLVLLSIWNGQQPANVVCMPKRKA